MIRSSRFSLLPISKGGYFMPVLRFKAIALNDLCKISKILVDDLQEVTKTPREHFTLEVPKSVYIKDNNIIDGPPMVEVFWFDRGQEVQDHVAKILTKYVQSCGYPEIDVIFTLWERSRYYENGEHF